LDTLPALALLYFLKDELGVGPAGTAAAIALTQLPWTLKPIYGFISDNYSIMGLRRKPYILVSMVTISLCWFSMAYWVKHEYSAILAMVMANIAGAVANVCVEALTVEYSERLTYKGVAILQSLLWGSCALASFAGAAFGGFTLNHGIDKHDMFAISAWVPLLAGISAAFSHEDTISAKAAEVTKSPSIFFSKIWTTLNPSEEERQARAAAGQHWTMGRVCLFLIIFFSVPNTSATNYFYLTNHLHMGETVLAVITTVAMGTYFFGVVCYFLCLKDIEIQTFLACATFTGSFVTALAILLYTRANLDMGIPDEAFVVTDSALVTAVKTVAQLPLMTLMAAICPDGIEGTLFSLFTSIANLGSVLGGWIGALLTVMFGITSTQFHLMWALCLTCALLQLFPTFFLWLLPSASCYAKIKAAKDQRNAHRHADDGKLNF